MRLIDDPLQELKDEYPEIEESLLAEFLSLQIGEQIVIKGLRAREVRSVTKVFPQDGGGHVVVDVCGGLCVWPDDYLGKGESVSAFFAQAKIFEQLALF